jgi:hypothetical protein
MGTKNEDMLACTPSPFDSTVNISNFVDPCVQPSSKHPALYGCHRASGPEAQKCPLKGAIVSIADSSQNLKALPSFMVDRPGGNEPERFRRWNKEKQKGKREKKCHPLENRLSSR